MGFVGKHGQQTLRRYKYSGIDRSIMSKYIFQPYWAAVVKLFPIWMPPNLITLTGFFFVVGSTLLSYLYAPHLDTEGPRYVYLFQAILLFLYQTFDAVDGKQARRTNSSSPLGELFDHGCDALACSFEGLAFGAALMIGRNIIWLWAVAAIPFYFATWETFHTGTLALAEINGPTEGLFLTYSAHFLTFLVGPTWWTLDYKEALHLPDSLKFLPGVQLNNLMVVVMMMFAVAPTVFSNISNVRRAVQYSKGGGGMHQAVLLLLPFTALCTMVCAWAWVSPYDVLGNQPYLLILGAGFSFGFLVGRVILSHLTDEPRGLKTSMCKALLPLPIALANALSARLLDGTPFFDEFWVLVGFVAYTFALYMYFAMRVISEITSTLGIKCFSTKKDLHRQA
ncbi:hypothetical protein CBR_g28542 [Chara braunii]|uniref:Uncharacterized protein n=1 Tax=Chara braunii TaxID=69332 RepID=A0A388JWA5_CHABU|nr:hypothetical protein CBR_g28542 [Chara braunii]|eukprot:GBG62065.1 hypothetical protein CBR_g28542 [Chara braunii]